MVREQTGNVNKTKFCSRPPKYNPKEIMNSSEVLHEIRDLKDIWRKQNFVYSTTQQAKFDNLLEQRRDIVKSYYKNNLVYKA